MDLESRIKEKDELNESAIEAFGRLNKEGFRTLVTKLIDSMGLEIINSFFEEEWAKIEADVGPQIRKANYPSYLIKVERRTVLVTPEDVQEFVSEREANDRGMIYISTSGFSSDARLYAKEFDVEIADDMAFAQLLRKFDLLDDVMIYKDKEILKGEKGRFLPSVEELENIIEMGKSAYAKGRLEEALGHFSHATQIKPKYDAAWVMKGVILSEQKKFKPALEAFMSALEINIENPKAWFSMGTTLFSLGRYEEELECYDKALELKPDFLPAYNNKGATLLHLERFEEAERTYDEILKLSPEFKLAWNNKGIALKKIKRTEEALECFTNAINIDSRYLDAWLNRGIMYFKEKRYKEAYFCFDSALKVEEDNIQALYYIAKTLEAVGFYSKALEIYDRIIKLDLKFYPAKRRKKKAAKYLEQKGDAKINDNFFILSQEEAKEYHLSPPEPEKERILVKKTVAEPEKSKNVQASIQPEFSEEHENVIQDVPSESLPKVVLPQEQKPKLSKSPAQPPIDIRSPVFFQETEDLKEMDKELKEKEQDLVQMEAWLRERYFTIENERTELKNIRMNLERKKENIDNEKTRAQRIADELEKKASNITRAEDELRTNRERLAHEREAIERERIELKYRVENITNESQGSVEDRIALERDIVRLELREKEITAANMVLIQEREKVEKESIALKAEMEKMFSASAELQARERSINSREDEMKQRFDHIVNKSGDMAIKEKELEDMARELKRTQDNLEKRAKALRENEKRLLEKQKILADNRAKMKGDIPSSPAMQDQNASRGKSDHVNVKTKRIKRDVSFTPSGVLDSKSVSTKPQIMQPPSLSMTLDFESVERELLAGELESLRDILIMYGVRNMDSAQKRAEQAQENGLDSKLIWNIKGNILRQKREYEKALECYNNALKRDQNYVVTLTNLMSLYYEMVRYDESLKLCKKILQLRPSDEKFILTKAILEARSGQMDEALTTINNLLLDNNKLDVVWNLKGVLLFGMNQDDDAQECFDEALKLNSECISALNNKGVILHNNGNFQDALKFFDHASKISSKEKIKQNIELTSKKLEGSEQLEVPPKDTGELDTEEEDNLKKENEPEDDVTESAITEQPESIEEKEEEPEIESPTPTDSEPNKETDKESASDIFSELGKISETVSEEQLLETDSESEDEMTEGSEDTELPSSDDGADLYMCPSCGSFVSPSADKCEKCGYAFDEEEDEEIEDHEDETELILPEQKELKDIKTEIEETVEEPEMVEKDPEVELIDDKIEEQKMEKPDLESKKGAQNEEKGKEDDKIPTKDQVIEKFILISGVGASKAEVIYEAGYTSYKSLRSAKISDVGNVKGIGKTLAKNIKDQLKKKTFKDK